MQTSFQSATRRSFLRIASLGLYAAALPAAKFTQSLVYFGTYTGPKSKGVHVSKFDAKTGNIEPARLAGEVVQPSWVTVHPNHRFLYAVSELGNNGREQASISSFSIDAASGELKFLNKVSSGGGGACHLNIDKTGKTIAVANYGTGSAATFALETDGKLGERKSLQQHHGSSVTRRQTGPHAHAVVFSADNRFLFVPDLGLDRFMIYKFDAATGVITPNDPPFASVKPGSGPRHFAFAPKSRFAYGLNEMGSSVTTFSYDAVKGALHEIQTISTLPADFKGVNNCAEIEVDPAGRFVYASNRGDDSITVFAIDRKSGKLTQIQREPTKGKTPRGFKIHPSGNFLLAANQNTDNMAVFRLDRKTGKLIATGQVLDVPAAVCIQFLIG